jgi:secreted PhoX family phosphatase
MKFTPVAKSLADQVWVPAGYTATVMHATGDTMNAGVAPYSNAGTDDAESWANRVGDQHDGTEIFYIGSDGKSKGSYNYARGDKAVLAVNNESSAEGHFFHPTGQTSGAAIGQKFDQFGQWTLGVRPASEAIKEILMHGVTLTEVTFDSSGKPTGYNPTSSLNRRITPETVMTVTGPAAELANLKALMVTKYDPTGSTTRGTLNNCGTGITPWGTLITCEENWAGFFRRLPEDDSKRSARELIAFKRYGIAGKGKELWATVQPDTSDFQFGRWNAAVVGSSNDGSDDFRNAVNTFGWVVEIDPFDPHSNPKKGKKE